MTTPVNKIVNVRISSSPTFPARKGFGLLNVIGSSARLPIGDPFRIFNDLTDVGGTYSTADEEYKAAKVHFSQYPKPTQIAISRRFAAAVPGELLGSIAYEKDLTEFTAISDGGFDITLDGVEKQIIELDLSAVTTFNGVASAIQAKLDAAATGTTCIFDGTRFIIRSATTGASSTVGYAEAPTGAGTPTDLSVLLGLTFAVGAKTTTGAAAESIETSLNRLQDLNQSWYGFVLTNEATEQNLKDAASWAEAQVKIYGANVSAAQVLDGSNSADVCSVFKSNLYRRTFSIWNDREPYQVVSALARGFIVNLNEQNSHITLKFKQLPGTPTIPITETQRLALIAKRCNYYTEFGDSAMLAEGVMASGVFFDEVHGLDWLQNIIETEAFGYLYTRPTKVPQTDKGMASIIQRVEIGCQAAVNAGLLAPGVWNGQDLGEVKSGAFLERGFYIYAPPVATQSQSDREARRAVPIQGLLKGAGALHDLDIGLIFER